MCEHLLEGIHPILVVSALVDNAKSSWQPLHRQQSTSDQPSWTTFSDGCLYVKQHTPEVNSRPHKGIFMARASKEVGNTLEKLHVWQRVGE
jgi:hypothetical protein